MRIGYFMTGLGQSGGPIVHYNFMNGLVQKGHTVCVVSTSECFEWSENAHLTRTASRHSGQRKLRVRASIRKRVRKSLGRVLRLSVTTSSHRPREGTVHDITTDVSRSLMGNYASVSPCDILIATHPYTADAVYHLRHGRKIVMFSLHFEELMYKDAGDRDEISKLNHLPFHHVVNSKWLQSMFRFNYGIDAFLVNPGLDLNLFGREICPLKFSEKTPIRILTYCDPRRSFKGYEQQIIVLEGLSRMRNDIEIDIYGRDPETNRFPYKYLGWLPQDRLADHYSQAHVLFSPSWYESFPYPPLEAMAAGCAVAAGPIGTDEYLLDGRTGVVIDPFDVEKTIEILDHLFDDRGRMLSLALAGKQMSYGFPWSRQSDRFEQYLRDLPSPRINLDIDRIQLGDLSEFSRLSIS